MKGINIEIRNLTNGHQMDMLQNAMKSGGSVDKALLDEDFLVGKMAHVITRKVLGATYKIEIAYDKHNDKFIVECS